MNCDDAKNKLVDRTFEDPQAVDFKELDEHLERCPSCFEEYLSIKRSIEYVDRGLTVPIVENTALKQAIKTDLRKEYGRSLWQLFSVRIPAYVAFAGVAAAIALTLMISSWPESSVSEGLSSAREESPLESEGGEMRGKARTETTTLAKYYDSIALQSKHVF